jgi:hypothetical protein
LPQLELSGKFEIWTCDPADAIEAARAEFDVREMYAGEKGTTTAESVHPAPDDEALFRTRTGDPSLPWKFESGTRAHGRSFASTFVLQIGR